MIVDDEAPETLSGPTALAGARCDWCVDELAVIGFAIRRERSWSKIGTYVYGCDAHRDLAVARPERKPAA